MPRLFFTFGLLVLVLAGRPASAFSLLGPTVDDPGGEAWQTVANGYSFDTDVGAVKNLTEEYRWNKPVITYAFDLSFINYFGTNGIAAVEAAMAVYNSLPDLSTLSQELNEFPLQDPVTQAVTTFRDSRRVNYTAQALNLIDMKSYTMSLLAEQLGLAPPERYVWTLKARETVGPLPTTNYFTIMRNFDPVTLQPSRYVNGNRYTYNIVEIDNPFRVFPLESPVDPESSLYSYSSVANFNGDVFTLTPGTFYTYLTRDDIGGLRYIYDRQNLNYERFSPGSQIVAPDTNGITLISNIDLSNFSLFTRFNDPATVQAAFPNLVILSNSVSFDTTVDVVGITVTNVRPPWSDPFTTWFEIVPILQTNLVLVYDYVFANVITNYSSPTTIVRTELFGFETEPWSTPANPVYRTNIIDEVIDVPSGAILIVPPNVARFEFVPGAAITNIFTITNTVFQTNVVDNGLLRPLFVAEYTLFTNVTYAVLPFTLQTPPDSVLRGGIGKITFERLGGAIFTGTNFLHTNSYTVVYRLNRFGTPQLITNDVRLVGAAPDILFAAADFDPDVTPSLTDRSILFQNNGDINSSTGVEFQGGPGNIFPSAIFTFNKVGPGLFNTRPGTATEEAALDGFRERVIWGSFDGSTNPPVAFPQDVTLEDIELLINGGIAP
jgi:hypothetical protein